MGLEIKGFHRSVRTFSLTKTNWIYGFTNSRRSIGKIKFDFKGKVFKSKNGNENIVNKFALCPTPISNENLKILGSSRPIRLDCNEGYEILIIFNSKNPGDFLFERLSKVKEQIPT